MSEQNGKSRAIIVENAGPVGTFVVPVQPGGTIVTGFCGTGKSITLEAIALGLGSKEKGRVSPRSGTKRGSVDCLGVMLNVSAGRITRSGESEVASIEEFDIGTLIDPPVKDDDARNRYGIKSLLRMTKAEADPALFYHLAGSKEAFDKIIDPDAVKSADLVDMAGKIKRAFESQKRRVEEQAEKEERSAAGLRNAGDGLDMKAETDTRKLQQALEDAAGLKSQLDEQARNARRSIEEAEAARQQLAKCGQQAESSQEAEKRLAAAQERRMVAAKEVDLAKQDVARLEIELKAARSVYHNALEALDTATDGVQNAKQAIDAVESSKALSASWQAAIDAAADVYEPSQEDLEETARQVENARQAIEQAAVIRAAKEKMERARQHQEAAAAFRKEALRLKEAARATDAVLSDAVASERYRVEGDMLVGILPDGTAKPYYAMSDGERTLIATDEKIDRVRIAEPDMGKLAIIDLPQRTFQDIPASIREMLFAKAAQKNTCIVTAQVNDSPKLDAIVWRPGLFNENPSLEPEAAGV